MRCVATGKLDVREAAARLPDEGGGEELIDGGGGWRATSRRCN